MEKITSSIFASRDLFSMTKFIITRLKGADHRNCVKSRSSLCCAIKSGELPMPSVVEVVCITCACGATDCVRLDGD